MAAPCASNGAARVARSGLHLSRSSAGRRWCDRFASRTRNRLPLSDSLKLQEIARRTGRFPPLVEPGPPARESQ
jgi:hypothetical protein